MNVITPDTHLYSLVDRNKIWETRKNHPEEWFVTAICDEILWDRAMIRWTELWKYPRTIIWTREYFKSLTTKLCWAWHERSISEFSAKNCPFRSNNIACLHGIDVRRHHTDWNLRLWADIWWIRVFATAYILNEIWYCVPLLIENLSKITTDMNKYDDWIVDFPFWDTDTNPKTKRFQEEISGEFQRKYIWPVRAEFERFWLERVDKAA